MRQQGSDQKPDVGPGGVAKRAHQNARQGKIVTFQTASQGEGGNAAANVCLGSDRSHRRIDAKECRATERDQSMHDNDGGDQNDEMNSELSHAGQRPDITESSNGREEDQDRKPADEVSSAYSGLMRSPELCGAVRFFLEKGLDFGIPDST